MANQYTSQIIKDSTKQTVIKLTGTFDGTGDESNSIRIRANSLYRALDANNNLLVAGNTAKPYYDLSIYRLWYDVNITGKLHIYWKGDDIANNMIFAIGGNGEYNNAGNWLSIPNQKIGANVTGDIGVYTSGAVANDSYTLIVELHKNNDYYDAGQLIEPNAFNYRPYGVTP